MNKYRVTKYNPEFRNSQGAYLKDEWTSFCDIGKVFDGVTLSKDAYLEVESKYCDVVRDVLAENQITEVVIDDLENDMPIYEIRERMTSVQLDLTESDEIVFNSLTNNRSIKIKDIDNYLRLILRECFWCDLRDFNSSSCIEFGYDYYVYVVCESISETLIQKYKNNGIFIEKMDVIQ